MKEKSIIDILYDDNDDGNNAVNASSTPAPSASSTPTNRSFDPNDIEL